MGMVDLRDLRPLMSQTHPLGHHPHHATWRVGRSLRVIMVIEHANMAPIGNGVIKKPPSHIKASACFYLVRVLFLTLHVFILPLCSLSHLALPSAASRGARLIKAPYSGIKPVRVFICGGGLCARNISPQYGHCRVSKHFYFKKTKMRLYF